MFQTVGPDTLKHLLCNGVHRQFDWCDINILENAEYVVAVGLNDFTIGTINDLGVIFDSRLTFKDHMAQKINKAYSILGIIKRNFIYMDESSVILLYKSMVRPHVDYANSMWCPYKQGDSKELEKNSKKSY